MSEWHFTAWCGKTQWIGLAKKSEFINGHPVYEPGEIWFEFGDTKDEALEAVKRSVMH